MSDTYPLFFTSVALLVITALIIGIIWWRGRKIETRQIQPAKEPLKKELKPCRVANLQDLKDKDVKDIFILHKTTLTSELILDQGVWVIKRATLTFPSNMKQIYYENNDFNFIYCQGDEYYGLLVVKCDANDAKHLTRESIAKIEWPKVHFLTEYDKRRTAGDRTPFAVDDIWKYEDNRDKDVFQKHIYTLDASKKFVNATKEQRGMDKLRIYVSTIAYTETEINKKFAVQPTVGDGLWEIYEKTVRRDNGV
jgi:hypothetical protein